MKRYLKTTLTLCLISMLLTASSCLAAPNYPVLKEVFSGDFLIGAALNENQVYGKNPKEASLITRHFNTITPENMLKWEAVHPKPDKYNFKPVDQLVKMGRTNDMFIVGHTLCWHQQTPTWVFQDDQGQPATRDMLLKRLKDHIDTVMGRYKGKIGGWDVLNEAIVDDGSMRKTKWQQIIGDDYVEKVFTYAHQADPDAELYYNDYNMWKKKHWQGVVKLVENLQAKGIRIDGVGMQGHWGFDYPPIDEAEACIEALGKLGIKVMITEQDLTVLPRAGNQSGADITLNYALNKKLNPYADGLPEDIQKKQADRYAEFFSLFYKYKETISRVTFWGVQDGNSWRNDWPVKGRVDYPMVFDRNCEPKLAFFSIIAIKEINYYYRN